MTKKTTGKKRAQASPKSKLKTVTMMVDVTYDPETVGMADLMLNFDDNINDMLNSSGFQRANGKV